MSATMAAALVPNHAVDVVPTPDGEALSVSAWSTVRGFVRTRLGPGEPGHAAAAAVVDGVPPDPAALSADAVGALWTAGLLVLPTERPAAFAEPDVAAAVAPFRARGFATLGGCVDRATVDVLVAHYRAAVSRGDAPIPTAIDRNAMHDDPAGRVVLAALRPAIEAIAGVPLKPSYSFASLYRPGASMPMHLDRAQCAYTLSLAIDHRPVPADGVSPWPLTVDPGDGTPPVDCLLPIGGGVLFRGTRLVHGRAPLPPGETCWTLLLHYVDVDFDGPLG